MNRSQSPLSQSRRRQLSRALDIEPTRNPERLRQLMQSMSESKTERKINRGIVKSAMHKAGKLLSDKQRERDNILEMPIENMLGVPNVTRRNNNVYQRQSASIRANLRKPNAQALIETKVRPVENLMRRLQQKVNLEQAERRRKDEELNRQMKELERRLNALRRPF